MNRLLHMQQHVLSGAGTTWSAAQAVKAYEEQIKYDGNGNIVFFNRNGSHATTANVVESQADMDRLSYIYPKDNNGQLTANRLRHILDGVSGSNYANKDLVNQAADNYHYDNIGNLTADPANGVSQIQWTVYGKISHITKTNGDALKYTYDATGNRIYKEYISGGVTSRTWYARDAQGNTLAVYGNKNGDSQVYWNEQDLYGSSRLGTWQPGITLTAGAGATAWSQEGLSRYELTNHLGNVLSTISDQRVGVDNDHNGTIDYYLPTIASYSDYTPFGMQMMDRNGSAGGYRYGFNGKENDNEVKGEGNQQDYGMRVYDPRVGRFLSVDPIALKFPELTPYQFASNTPIQAIDLDGLEKFIIHYKIENGCYVVLRQVTDNSLKYWGGPTVYGQPTIHPKVVQFIKEDENGKVLEISGEIALKNFGSTLYVGPFNPKKADGKSDTYDYPAINSLDLAAKHHDQSYDKVQAKGATSAILDLKTIDADKQLVKDAFNVIEKYYFDQNDPVNKEPISLETKNAALTVVKIFSAIVVEKTLRIKANEAANATKDTYNKIKETTQEVIRNLDNLNKIGKY
ncbi:RHS repeat domain-containing protein [Chitinophaga costaii]|nr:RHS repeat-associated core domain-containing protein [Chitinophaga costaii]